MTNESPRCTSRDCDKRAKFEVRLVDGVLEGFACKDHKPSRDGGRAPYAIGVDHCTAIMDDGLPCAHQVRFRIKRAFSGLESYACGTHIPKYASAIGAIEVVALSKELA
jgi:hypothetical protein